MKPKILVVGAGAWGKNIIRTCDELGVLWGVADTDIEKRKDAMSLHYNLKNVDSDLATILRIHKDEYQPDAVIIATPPSTHYELAKQALRAGKHVLVEKPMAMKSIQGKFLVKLAADKGKTLMVGHLMRYHGAFMQLLHLVKMGDLGTLRYIQSNRLNDGKVRQDENVLWSFAPHDISMILALAGEMPHTILAVGDAYVTPGVHDVTTTHLKFPSGLSANIHVNWLYPHKEQSLVVIGSEGRAVFDDTEPIGFKLIVNGRSTNYPIERSPLTNEIQVFINCIEQANHYPITDGAEGVQVLEVLEAAQQSLLGQELSYSGLDVEEETFPQTAELTAKRPLPDFKLPEKRIVKIKPNGPFSENDPCSAPTKAELDAMRMREKELREEYSEAGDLTPEKPEAVLNWPHLSIQIDPYTGLIANNAQIGAGTKVWAFSQVHENCTIGKDCTIGTNVQIGPNVTIGDNVKIQNNVSVYDGVTIEDDVFIGPSVVFTNVKLPRSRLSGTLENTYVSKGATIGANATIVCGVTIGEYAMVGAGAVVTKDVRPYTLVVGNPAVFQHEVDKKGQPWFMV